jgi:hypothetical protein
VTDALSGQVTAPLGLGVWKDAVKDKLKTLDHIHRFAVGCWNWCCSSWAS